MFSGFDEAMQPGWLCRGPLVTPNGLDPVGLGDICQCCKELMGMYGKGMSGFEV